MAKVNCNSVKIRGIATAVPTKVVEVTSFYDQFGQEVVDNFIGMTGVKSFHITPEEQTASDLCYVAARELLKSQHVDPQEIGILIFVSQTPDYRLPATACVLQHRLNLPKNCMAFDINLGCSGWVYGISVVSSLLESTDMGKALLLFGDTSVKTASPMDRSSIMLFGEAGSATLIEKKESAESGIFGEYQTDGSHFKTIIIPSGAFRNRNGSHERVMWGDENIRSDYDGYMNGTDTFTFTISEIPKQIKKFLQERDETPENYDALLLHQANLFILKQISKKTKFPMDKIPISLDRYGNTSGTSIPLTICDAYGGKGNGKMRILADGFGVGLSWGVLSFQLDTQGVLPPILTDESFDDGGVSHE